MPFIYGYDVDTSYLEPLLVKCVGSSVQGRHQALQSAEYKLCLLLENKFFLFITTIKNKDTLFAMFTSTLVYLRYLWRSKENWVPVVVNKQS